MNINSTDFENLEPGTELLMVRYSQSPHPDYEVVAFNTYNKDNRGTLEYTVKKNDRIVTKKTNKRKALYRFFTDTNEMAKSLYDCFKKRNIDDIPKDFGQLMNTSQEIRPEIWI